MYGAGMLNLNLRHLHFLVALRDEGSFARAAERLMQLAFSASCRRFHRSSLRRSPAARETHTITVSWPARSSSDSSESR
jgi:hypothetical protein